MAEQSLGPGAVLAGRYRLVAQIGQGGMGAVWRAEHLTLRSSLAVKLIDVALASSPEVVNRFLREAQAAAALKSPHVVQIIDYGLEGEVPFIAMELMDGEDLSHRLERLGRLTPAETARVLTHVGRAIGKAHEAGIVHRDLKPDNIFIVRNEDDEIAKVLDFGVAKALDSASGLVASTDTRTGTVIGTPHYMSPEQARGDRAVDWRSDLWALAVIAYECLLGIRPFEAEGVGSLLLAICSEPIPVPSAVGVVPPGFDAWFAKAASREPQARFQSAREMTDALHLALGGTLPAGLPSLPGGDWAGAPSRLSPAAQGSAGGAPTSAAPIAGLGTTTGQVAATALAVSGERGSRRGLWFGGSLAALVVVAGLAALVGRGRSGDAEAPLAASSGPGVAAPPGTPLGPARAGVDGVSAAAPSGVDGRGASAPGPSGVAAAAEHGDGGRAEPSPGPRPIGPARVARPRPASNARVAGPGAAPPPAPQPVPGKIGGRDIGF